MSTILHWVGAVILLIGVCFTLVAAIGVVRLPDIYSRMHGSSKPQMLGLSLVILGVILDTQDVRWLAVGLVILMLQFITAPVGTSMLAQAVEETSRPGKKSGKKAAARSLKATAHVKKKTTARPAGLHKNRL